MDTIQSSRGDWLWATKCSQGRCLVRQSATKMPKYKKNCVGKKNIVKAKTNTKTKIKMWKDALDITGNTVRNQQMAVCGW